MKKYFYPARLPSKPGNIIGKPNLRPANNTGPAFCYRNGFKLPYFLLVSDIPQMIEKPYPFIKHLDKKAGMHAAAYRPKVAAKIILLIGGAP